MLVTLMVIFFVSTPLNAVLLTLTAFLELITIVFTDFAPVKAGWVNGLNWLNWGEKSIMHKMLGGMWSRFG